MSSAGSCRRKLAAIGVVPALVLAGCGSSIPTPSSAATPTPAPTPAAGLYVDAGADQGPISPLIFGSNMGPWLTVPFDLQTQVAAAGVKTLTFPGGNWGDEYNLMDYQVDQFINYCRLIGAEPRIVARLKGGTAQQAADLVKYANVTKGYNVKYWGIGNEADLYSLGALPDYTVAQYNEEWREWAQAMRAVDSKIVLIGPDVSQFVADANGSPYMQTRIDWLTSFLHANGDMVDIVSIHRYPFPTDSTGQLPTKNQLRQNSKEWDEIIPALRKIIREQTNRDLPVAVTEVNSSSTANSSGEATMDSLYNAIWFGDVLGRMIKQDVLMVDQFALAGDYGIVGRDALYPMYYVYMMYQRFGSERLRAASDDPLVQVYAARRADGTLTVMIVNFGSAPATKPLTIVAVGAAASAETWLFDQDHTAQQTGATALGGTVTVPGESMTLLIVGK
jgi:hypothetical protein